MEIHSLKWHRGNMRGWHPPSMAPTLLQRPAAASAASSRLFQRAPAGGTFSEGHVSPRCHSWLSRQTGRRSDTSLLGRPGGEKISNFTNVPPSKLKPVTAPYKLTSELHVSTSGALFSTVASKQEWASVWFPAGCAAECWMCCWC